MCVPSICSRLSAVMLWMRFLLARSRTCISLVIFRTTASDSVAFSRIRDICPRRSCVVSVHGNSLHTVKSTYRDHLLNDLHARRVLLLAELFPQQSDLTQEVAFILRQPILNGLEMTQRCLYKQ